MPATINVLTASDGPFYPVIQPSSGNLQGSGTPTQHGLVWSDSNPIFWADVLELNSTDPSAIASITVSGTPANGTLMLTYVWGGTVVNLPISVTAGMTTAQAGAAIVTAIQANSTLFTPASPTRLGGGGYDLGGLIGYVVATSSVVAYDYDSRQSVTVSYTPGTSGITLTFGVGQSTPGTPYAMPLNWDNNPVFALSRFVDGMAPPPGSVIFGMQINSNDTSSLHGRNICYGTLELQVLNATAGALASRWGLITANSTGGNDQGLFIGAGAYTVNVADKGVDTVNAKQFWVNSTEQLVQTGTSFQIVSGVGHDITLSPGGVPRATVLPNGNAGLGTETNPQYSFVVSQNVATGLNPAAVNGAVLIGKDGAPSTGYSVMAYGGNGAINFFRFNGSATAPSNLAVGDIIGAVTFSGYGNNALQGGRARILGMAAEPWNGSTFGTSLQFDTTPVGGARTQGMHLKSGLIVGPSSPDPGAGCLRLTPQLFASLSAAAGSTTSGRLAVVTDSATTAWGAAITGGGTNVVLAFDNGSNWTVAAK